GGTVARFRVAAMHVPLDVPANGASLTVALETLPLGSKVTITVASPVGPPASLHLAVSKAAAASALLAAFRSKRWPVTPFLSDALFSAYSPPAIASSRMSTPRIKGARFFRSSGHSGTPAAVVPVPTGGAFAPGNGCMGVAKGAAIAGAGTITGAAGAAGNVGA